MRSQLVVVLTAMLSGCADDGGVSPGEDTGSTGSPTTTGLPSTSSSASTSASTGSTEATSSSSESSSSSDSSSSEGSSSSESSSSSGDATSSSSDSSSGDPSSSSTGEPAACIDLGNALPVSIEGDTTGEDDDVPVTGTACTITEWSAEDVTYTWTAPAAGWYRFIATPEFSNTPAITLLDACEGTPLQCELGNYEDYGSWVAAELAAGQTIAIAVDARLSFLAGPFELEIEAMPECSAAIDLGSEVVVDLVGDTSGAGDESWIGCGYANVESDEDVTYTWTAPQTGLYRATIRGEGLSGGIGVFRGECNNPGDQVACAITTGLDEFATTAFPAAADEELWIVADTFINSDTTTYEIDIEFVDALQGDCCTENATAGCSDLGVASCVCEIVPECCTAEAGWLAICAGIAGDVCGACEPVDPGNCCDAHGGLSCDEPFVAECACQAYYGCCDDPFWGEPWGDWCIQNADAYCNIECT